MLQARIAAPRPRGRGRPRSTCGPRATAAAGPARRRRHRAPARAGHAARSGRRSPSSPASSPTTAPTCHLPPRCERRRVGPARSSRPRRAVSWPAPCSPCAWSRPMRPPTLVFDEVDAGIGGEAGTAVGRLLGVLGRDHQVLCVTHLAQVAAFADRQVVVEKVRRGGRTVARTQRSSTARTRVRRAVADARRGG